MLTRKEIQRRFYQRHREEILASKKAYYTEHPEKLTEKTKTYNEKHREEIRERNKQWQKDNPEIMKRIRIESESKKRAIKNKSDVSVTVEELNKLIENSNNICFWCDKEIDVMHLDHIYPLSKGGGHTISNIVVSCASCNIKKNAKAPEVFLEEILTKQKQSQN